MAALTEQRLGVPGLRLLPGGASSVTFAGPLGE
jgi:hypothetical protein